MVGLLELVLDEDDRAVGCIPSDDVGREGIDRHLGPGQLQRDPDRLRKLVDVLRAPWRERWASCAQASRGDRSLSRPNVTIMLSIPAYGDLLAADHTQLPVRTMFGEVLAMS